MFRLLAAIACAHSFRVDCYNSVLFLGWFHTRNFIGNETGPQVLVKGDARFALVVHYPSDNMISLFPGKIVAYYIRGVPAVPKLNPFCLLTQFSYRRKIITIIAIFFQGFMIVFLF